MKESPDELLAEWDRLSRPPQVDHSELGWKTVGKMAEERHVPERRAKLFLKGLVAAGKAEYAVVPMLTSIGRLQSMGAYRLKPKGKP